MVFQLLEIFFRHFESVNISVFVLYKLEFHIFPEVDDNV